MEIMAHQAKMLNLEVKGKIRAKTAPHAKQWPNKGITGKIMVITLKIRENNIK